MRERGGEERELGFKRGYKGGREGERAMRTAENRGTWHMAYGVGGVGFGVGVVAQVASAAYHENH